LWPSPFRFLTVPQVCRILALGLEAAAEEELPTLDEWILNNDEREREGLALRAYATALARLKPEAYAELQGLVDYGNGDPHGLARWCGRSRVPVSSADLLEWTEWHRDLLPNTVSGLIRGLIAEGYIKKGRAP